MSEMSELRTVPGVGPSIERDLLDLGLKRVPDLVDQDPDELFQRLALIRGSPMDRCVLYVFRCAIYYAREERHDPELLKWWNWKDRDLESGSDGKE